MLAENLSQMLMGKRRSNHTEGAAGVVNVTVTPTGCSFGSVTLWEITTDSSFPLAVRLCVTFHAILYGSFTAWEVMV